MTLHYWVLSDVSLFITASVVIFNFSAISCTAFLFAASLIPYCYTSNCLLSICRTSTACRINVVRLLERHDYADMTSLALSDFSVSKWVSINLVHRCIAEQCMTLK